MKALSFKEHGGPEVLTYTDVPDPQPPGPGEVLVQVKATSLNHLDIWVQKGWPHLELAMPHWGGADVSGVIADLGEGVRDWEIGRRVVVDPGISTREDEFTRSGEDSVSPGYRVLGENVRGAHAEYVTIPAKNLVAMPAHLDFPSAAAPLLVTLAAWRMLITRARLRAGETILIVGAGGGVNSMAIQIAKLAGAKVYVVAGGAHKAALAEELGADLILDRNKVDWGREIFRITEHRGVDVVVDNVGAATLETSIHAVVRGGRIVIIGNTRGPQTQIDIRYIFGKQISLVGSTMGSHQDFFKVTELLWSGKLRPVIDRVMPLREGVEACTLMERGKLFGKVVLEP
ncbi:MAG: zinc-binding dehydrogenase [Deltaproteobacteria bacterium]|nr:zinc-binding dehydrogenase [Deltaproteobacteria bacterium]